jgi:hypothetical protein
MIFAFVTSCNSSLRIKRRVHPTLFSYRDMCSASENGCKLMKKLLAED